MEQKNKSESRQFERCVRCVKETEYTTDDPITIRYHYVDGAGQLCKECYAKLAKLNDRKESNKVVPVSNEKNGD